MSKTKWIEGFPSARGLYWYDTGHRFGAKDTRFASLLLFTGEKLYVFGHFASFPIDNPLGKVYANIKHMPIDKYAPWFNQTAITEKSITWVKTPEERIGLALLTTIHSNGISSTIIWMDNDMVRVDVGTVIKEDDEYSFSPVEPPLLK